MAKHKVKKFTEAVRKRWLKALRSGEYAQGRGQLLYFEKNNECQYCCLGVLAEVMYGENIWKKEGRCGVIPAELDLDHVANDVMFCPPGLKEVYATRLAKYNDRGKNFEKIADYIEKRVHPE